MGYPEDGPARPSLLAPKRGTRRPFAEAAGKLRTLFRLRRLYWVRAELKFAPTETQRLFALTVVLGVVCGLAAVAFHLSIGFVERHVIDRALHAQGHTALVLTVLVPTLGGLLCGALLHYVVPNARGSGIPQVKAAFANPNGHIRLRDAFGKFVIGSLQIGSGASLGREGPTVHICAGIASSLGRLARVSPESQRRLLPVGAAAGIAAAFNAPIAAVTFVIEEVVGKLDQAVLSGVIVAAALAAVIERSVLGENPVFNVPENYGLQHASSLAVYALIGIAAAVVSVAFCKLLLGLRLWFRALPVLPVWARPALGGLVTGGLAAFALGIFGARGVTSGGYDTLSQALTGELSVRLMLVLCALKLFATVFSYSSGGAGGIFAPSLFLGGTLGGAIGTLDQTLLGHYGEPMGAFALVGMGAVFAGVIRAPITSVLIIVEMTDGYSLILPLMIANMTAYALSRRWARTPIYEALMLQDGLVPPPLPAAGPLESVPIASVLYRSSLGAPLSPATSASDVAKRSAESPGEHVFAVVDANARLIGIVTPEELRILAAEPDLLPLANAADMMRPPVSVRADDTLRTALDAMVENGIGEVPVIDAEGRLIGLIDEGVVARAYMKIRKEAPSG
jgi:CIC family chloride channel protein